MLLSLAVALTLLAMIFLLVLRSLPDGRSCPACGSTPLRRSTFGPPGGVRRRALAGLVDRGHCAGCGWRGPVRRGPHAQRVPRSRGRMP